MRFRFRTAILHVPSTPPLTTTSNSYPANPLSSNPASDSSADGVRGRQTRGHAEGHAEEKIKGNGEIIWNGPNEMRVLQGRSCQHRTFLSPSLIFSAMCPRGRAVVCRLIPTMFGYLSVGQILRIVRVADKYNLAIGGELFELPS